MLAILIVMNNYFHDVATAMLASLSILLLIIYRQVDERSSPEQVRLLLTVYRKFTGYAKIALALILLGGIPRTLAYKDYEWLPALGKGIIPALIIKHVLMFTLVGLGLHFWRLLARKADLLQSKSGCKFTGGV